MFTRTDIINYLIDKNNLKSYLEIGVGNGANFNSIKCESKECCDPYITTMDGCCERVITYKETSDEMFSHMDKDKKYDIIFIDGLHEGNQVLRDVYNSLKHISDNGFILIHDSLPITEERSHFPRNVSAGCAWNGSVFKAYPVLKENNVEFSIISMDEGIGLIKGDQKEKEFPLKESEMSWKDVFRSDFDYRKEFNVISHRNFLEMF